MTKPTSSRYAPPMTSEGSEPDTNGTPPTVRKSVPISTDSVGQLIPVPPWRRMAATWSARLKHQMFGIHSPLPTLHAAVGKDGMTMEFRLVSECLVCDKVL